MGWTAHKKTNILIYAVSNCSSVLIIDTVVSPKMNAITLQSIEAGWLFRFPSFEMNFGKHTW